MGEEGVASKAEEEVLEGEAEDGKAVDLRMVVDLHEQMTRDSGADTLNKLIYKQSLVNFCSYS